MLVRSSSRSSLYGNGGFIVLEEPFFVLREPQSARTLAVFEDVVRRSSKGCWRFKTKSHETNQEG